MKNINIIAMAGSGRRFANKNFNLIKPLVLFRKKPMLYYAVKSLPFSKKKIFICRNSHFQSFRLNKVLKKFFKNFKFIKLYRKNSGQAMSCNHALSRIPADHVATFGSSDYYYNFNRKKFRNLIKRFDLVIFVTKPDKIMLKNPNQYGWIKKSKKNKVEKINCKKKVSIKPNKDYVIVGSFSFKNKKIFAKSFKSMLKKKQKINNEYYMDIVAKNTLLLDYKVGFIKVFDYKNFGTPNSLKSYEKQN